MSPFKIAGLHHVTATVNDAQADYKFYANALGLRLVKKTVNFDDNQVYHLYYGNKAGDPGTIMTTFPYKGRPDIRRGMPGTGLADLIAFSVPEDSLPYWKERLGSFSIEWLEFTRFGQPALHFEDPSGLEIELIPNKSDIREPWTEGQISKDVAILGLHSITLSLAELGPSREFLEQVFGMEVYREEGKLISFRVPGMGPGGILNLRDDGDSGRGKNGIGTIHHVAFAIRTEKEQEKLREYLLANDFNVTPLKDRKYFRSIYFRMPGKVLFEVATMAPGFTVDEPEDSLGLRLQLPEWEEENRMAIESVLPALD